MRNFAICSVFLVYGIYAYSAVHTIQTLEDNQTITGKKVFASSITVRGIELTSDGIKFPDGTIQVTSAPVSVSGGGPSSAEFDAIYFKITNTTECAKHFIGSDFRLYNLFPSLCP